MRKFTLKPLPLFIIFFSLLLIFLSSCSDLFHIQIEKRRYNKGYSVDMPKSNKQTPINTKRTEKKNIGESTSALQYADSSSTNETQNEVWVFQTPKNTPEQRSESKKVRKPEVTFNKNDFKKAIKVETQKIKANTDKPCPDKSMKLIIFGIVLMLIGGVLCLVPNIIAIAFGVVISLVGLILYFVGEAAKEPYVVKTEKIEISKGENRRSTLNVAQFDYKAEASTNTKEISLSLLTPQYAPQFKYKLESPFSDFIKSMEKDFEEILYERQYTFIGPFKTYDEMVYNEKSKTDLLLEIEIDLSWKDDIHANASDIPQYANETWSCGVVRKIQTGSVRKYSFKGTAGIGAEISIKASEIMTKQKVWVKKISITPEYMPVQSENYYDENKLPDNIWLMDAGFYNPMVELLERYYQQILSKAWNHLDPNELKLLKPQIEKIRQDSGFERK